MNKRLLQMWKHVSWMQRVAGSVQDLQNARLLVAVCLVWLFCITWPGQVEGKEVSKLLSNYNWGSYQEVERSHAPLVYHVTHHPAGPTMYHDYYQQKTDRNVGQLVRLVESAHTKRILPLLQQSFKRPAHKKSYLRQALREVKYTLERLVNHPKALALSATVANLIGQPKMPITFYQRAISMYPKHAITHAQFGNFLVGVGDLDDGIERLKVAIKIRPKMAAAYGWLAWAYHKKGDAELAQKYSTQAKERNFKGKLP